MSCSKPLPPFTYELLCFLNREQLERFSIICRPLKNLINRYFQSKPYRIFDVLEIRGGSYALVDDNVPWHPNREDYSAQQFLGPLKTPGGKKRFHPRVIEPSCRSEMQHRRIKSSLQCHILFICRNASIFGPDCPHKLDYHIRSWRFHVQSGSYRGNGVHCIPLARWRPSHCKDDDIVITAEDFQLILNSPTILQCRRLKLVNARFPFKNYKILYTVKVIELFCYLLDDVDPNYWLEFLEQPIVALHSLCGENIDNALDHLKQAFSSAVSPNAFKVVFVQEDEPLTEFRVTNKTSGENLELKKGLPVEYPEEWLADFDNYTFERSSV
ncbi:hypothetical protein DdX_18736 [Ditylenchus destructor]|uniref:F-box domain-containing protein n=1 Tax=Ditylenchus destructor TaxID=166010 RepID=A0AAD4MKC5_9BILA|nr:hypothetical protein DdX_18736 [Ditylenchus destructor]